MRPSSFLQAIAIGLILLELAACAMARPRYTYNDRSNGGGDRDFGEFIN